MKKKKQQQQKNMTSLSSLTYKIKFCSKLYNNPPTKKYS